LIEQVEELKRLTAEVVAARSEHEALTRKQSQLQVQTDQLEKKVTQQKQIIAEGESRKQNAARLLEETDNAEQRLTVLRTEVQKHEEMIASMKQQEQQLEKASEHLSALKHDVDQLTQEYNKIQEHLPAARREYEEIQTVIEENRKIKELLTAHKNDLQLTESKLKHKSAELSKLTEKLEKIREHVEVGQHLADLKIECSKLEGRIENARRIDAEMITQLKQKRHDLDDINAEIKTALATIARADKLKVILVRLTEEKEKLDKEIEMKNDELNKLKAFIARLKDSQAPGEDEKKGKISF
jgi:chromosome segregation ATPase